MSQKNIYAFIGGDLRQVFLMKRFMEAGKSCISFGLPLADKDGYPAAATLAQAVGSAKYLLCPTPFARSSSFDCDLLLPLVREGQILFGGGIPKHAAAALTEKGVIVFDYLSTDELTVFNSIATAEGILAEAIMAYPGNLHQSQCLVLGYGHCAKTLAAKLKGLDARVTVSARSSAALALADAMGHNTIPLAGLVNYIDQFDLVFNTIPEIIITAPVIEKMAKNCYIFDLASAPGGVEQTVAHKFSIFAKSYPGLPGKYAPEASAAALYRFIIQSQLHLSAKRGI